MMTKTTTLKSPQITGQRLLFLLALVCCLGAAFQTKAESLTQNTDDIFIPNTVKFYNPLTKSGAQERSYRNSTVGLDNVALYQSAEHYRSNIMSSSQRALNHQWLQQQQTGDGVRHGSKVLSRIFKMGFKTYWNGIKNTKFRSNNLVPNGSGGGKVSNDLDYRVRLSGEKLKVSLKYEF